MKLVQRRSVPPAALALLAAAFLYPAPALHAAPPTWQEEVELERSCEEWQKVRRCLEDDGEIGLECAAKSPFARFLSMFRSPRQDDEVRVEVVRRAPDDPAATEARARSDESRLRDEKTETRESRQVVEKRTETESRKGSDARSATKLRVERAESDLPRCGDGR